MQDELKITRGWMDLIELLSLWGLFKYDISMWCMVFTKIVLCYPAKVFVKSFASKGCIVNHLKAVSMPLDL